MNQVHRNEDNLQVSKPDEIHTFSLRPLNSLIIPHREVEVCFKPLVDGKGQLLSVLPTFNCDANPFTPAFMLGLDKNLQKLQGDNSTEENQFTFKDKAQDAPKFLQQEPRHNYCHICKQTYTSYQKHIENKIHKKRLKNSMFEEIQHLINYFKVSKNSQQKKANKPLPLISLDGEPRKRRIVQNPLTFAATAVKLAIDSTQSTNFSLFSPKKKLV